MSHPRIHHCRRLVGRTGAGPRAPAPRRGGLVDGHDRRGAHPNLDRRVGPAGARRDLAPCDLRGRAGKSVAIFGELRRRAGTWLAAWSSNLALVSVSRPLGVLLSAATGQRARCHRAARPFGLVHSAIAAEAGINRIRRHLRSCTCLDADRRYPRASVLVLTPSPHSPAARL